MAPKCMPSARPVPGMGSRLHSRPLAAATFREPCFADGRRELRELEPPFDVTKLLSQFCLNLPNSTDFGAKEGRKGEREGGGKKKGGKQQGRIRGSWPELVEQVEDRETPPWDSSVPQDSHPEGRCSLCLCLCSDMT